MPTGGIEPPRAQCPTDFKSGASTDSATSACGMPIFAESGPFYNCFMRRFAFSVFGIAGFWSGTWISYQSVNQQDPGTREIRMLIFCAAPDGAPRSLDLFDLLEVKLANRVVRMEKHLGFGSPILFAF